jgi:hypothetical protein
VFLDELPRLQRAAADFKAGAIARGRRLARSIDDQRSEAE